MSADEQDRVVGGAIRRPHRDPGEVQQVEQVRVAELVRERDGEHVERPHGTVRLEREGRDPLATHDVLEVEPRVEGPLGHRRRTLVEHLVEDLDALVRLPDLVRVRVGHGPAGDGRVPGRGHGVVLAADVLRGLAHLHEPRLERGPHAGGCDRRGGGTHRRPVRRRWDEGAGRCGGGGVRGRPLHQEASG